MKIPKKTLASLFTAGAGITGIYYSMPANAEHPEADSMEIKPENIDTKRHIKPTTNNLNNQYINKDSLSSDELREWGNWRNESVEEKFPGESEWIIKEIKKGREVDPVNYRYYFNKPPQRKLDLKYGIEKVGIVRDYTLMIANCNSWATGWILDYVLPDKEKGENYPTKFFIGSNAHVLSRVFFDKSNPYKQTLNDPRKDRKCEGRAHEQAGVTLVKEKVEHDISDFDRSTWKGNYSVHRMVDYNYKYDVSLYTDKNTTHDPDKWHFIERSPKLFYMPYQYLGTDRSKWGPRGEKFRNDDYTVDFAVMEVDFKNENVAKLFTRDFYGKYDHEIGRQKNKALNFFARPIVERYPNNHDLFETDIHVFGAGYPYNGMHNKSTSTYNANKQEASRFGYWSNVRRSNGEALLGHTDMWITNDLGKDGNYKWGGKTMYSRGYGYAVADSWLSGGASGSLYMEENGNVLGVLALEWANTGIIGALRNAEIKDLDGSILAPAYDLMEGVPGQNGSYKEQIQKYFISKGQHTALSKLRKWKAT